jgi:predicted amidohydrolase
MRALLAQVDPVPGVPAAGAARIAEELAAHEDADLAIFPELHLGGYDLSRLDETALTLEDPVIGRVREAAERSGTAVVTGFAERLDDGRPANAALVVDERGEIAAVYRKANLFGREADAFEPGGELVVADAAGAALGLLICFDVEFPEPARALARSGAGVLVTVAANMAPYFADHELASRARALDNRRPHLYVNRVGAEDGESFVGGTRAIASDGSVIAEAPPRGERVLLVEVPLAPRPAGEVDEHVDYLALVRDDLPVRHGTIAKGEA